MSRRSSTGSSARSARALHLDAFSGIAGNMFLGALLDLGVSRRALEAELAGLGLDFKLRVESAKRGAIAARYVDVLVAESGRGSRRRYVSGNAPARAGDPHHDHHDHGDHDHDHDHDRDHDRDRDRAPKRATRARPHAHGRSYAQIRALLRKAKLASAVRERALAAFEVLARAEAKVHGTAVDDVHFHEVGAVDAIVDITGVAAGLELLGASKITCSPVALGHGRVETAHGRLPLPAPATLELLRGVPTEPAHVAWETVTPTGAALLRACVDEYGSLPAMTVDAIGHGAGRDRPGPMPNVLRAVLGRANSAQRDRVVVLETQLDDLVPEHFEFAMQALFDAGALDVSLEHVQMKKNRPGFLVRALARPSDRLAVARALFAHSTAIGVRTSEWDRIVLAREEMRVATPFGRIRVKVVRDLDGAASVSAEYDDCKRAATKHGAALRDVVRAAEDAAREAIG